MYTGVQAAIITAINYLSKLIMKYFQQAGEKYQEIL